MSISTEISRKIPAGWYPCREDRSLRRWWNGVEWTEYYAPLQKPSLRLVETNVVSAVASLPPTTAVRVVSASRQRVLGRLLLALVCSLAGMETVLALLLIAHNAT
jgi:hypothetical protein